MIRPTCSVCCLLGLSCVVCTDFRFLYPTSSVGKAVSYWIPKFNEKTNNKHNIIATPVEFKDMRAEIDAELKNGLGQYAGFVWLSGEIATNGPYLADLTDKVFDDSDLRWPDVAAFFRKTLVYENMVVMMQIDGDIHNFNYRKDILDRDGKPHPQTLLDVKNLAVEYNGTDLNDDGEPDYGFCFAFPDAGADIRTIGILVMSYYAGGIQTHGTRHGVLFDPDDLSYNIDNSVFKNIMTLLKSSLIDGSNIDVIIENGDGWKTRKLFLSGRCLFYLDWADIPVMLGTKNLPGVKLDPVTNLSWAATTYNNSPRVVSGPAPGHRIVWDRKTKTARTCDANLCPFADSNGLNRPAYAAGGGWSLMVNPFASQDEQDAVFEFFAFVAAPEQNLIDVLNGSTGMEPCRYSQLSYQLWEQQGMEPLYAQQWLEATKRYFEDLNLVMEPPIMLGGLYQEAVGKYFMQFLRSDDMTVDDLVVRILADWDLATVQAGGKDSQIKSYRKGLGLPDLIIACPPGQGQKRGTSECEACNPGNFSTGGKTGCVPCPEASEAPDANSSVCVPCKQGMYKDKSGATACMHCQAGRFQDQWGTSACTLCDLGKLQGEEGQLSCEDCAEGTYAAHRGSSKCNQLQEGYMAQQETDDASKIYVYKCFGRKNSCPAGRNLSDSIDKMCSNGHIGRSCAQCRDEMYPSDEGCESCGGLLFGNPSVNVIGTLIVSVIVSERMFYSSMFPPEDFKLVVMQLLAFFQAILVVREYGMAFESSPSRIRNVYNVFKILELDFADIGMPLECSTGWDFKRRYAFTVFKWLWIWLGFAILFSLSHLLRYGLPKISRTMFDPDLLQQNRNSASEDGGTCASVKKAFAKLPQLSKHRFTMKQKIRWYYPIDTRDLVNAFLKTQNAWFILMTSNSLLVFRTETQPTEQETVISYPDVIVASGDVGSPEWINSIPIAIFGLFLFCISFISIFVYAVIVAPVRMGESRSFVRAFRGLWDKFDVAAWWFGVVHLIYNVLLNLIPVLLPREIRLQLVFAVILNSTYILVLCHVRPWKFAMNHVTDLLTKMGFTTFVLFFVGGPMGDPIDMASVGVLMLVAIFLPLVVVTVIVLHSLYYTRINEVAEFGRRAAFAERLHDIVAITSSYSFLDLRSFAIDLDDNDVRSLDGAVDTLLYTMLGLQSTSIWKRRAGAKLLKINIPGRLEGEMQHRNVDSAEDARVELRNLQSILRKDLSNGENSGRGGRSASQRSLDEGSMPSLEDLFKEAGRDASEELSGNEFVKLLEVLTSNRGETIAEETSKKLFQYVDLYQDGMVSPSEFYHLMTSLPTPVLDNGELPGKQSSLRRTRTGIGQTQWKPVEQNDQESVQASNTAALGKLRRAATASKAAAKFKIASKAAANLSALKVSSDDGDKLALAKEQNELVAPETSVEPLPGMIDSNQSKSGG